MKRWKRDIQCSLVSDKNRGGGRRGGKEGIVWLSEDLVTCSVSSNKLETKADSWPADIMGFKEVAGV